MPVTVFTSVSESTDNNQLPRIPVPRNKKGLRVGPIDIKRKNSDGETSHSTQDYAPEIQDDAEILDEMSMELLEKGIKIKSGQHLFVDLEESSIDNSKIISIEGDQAVRVAFTTNSGHLISSSEIPQHVLPHQLNIPVNSRIIHVFGYGDISESSSHLNLGSNSISLNCSTDNTTAVGFQAQSRIIGIPNTLLICRGGVVRFDHLTTDQDCDLEYGALENLAKDGQVMVYKHDSIWRCMDVEQDVVNLNQNLAVLITKTKIQQKKINSAIIMISQLKKERDDLISKVSRQSNELIQLSKLYP